jgi:hypothetical protein
VATALEQEEREVSPQESVVRIAAPQESVVRIAAPQESVVRIAAPQESVVRIAAPQESVVRIAAPDSPPGPNDRPVMKDRLKEDIDKIFQTVTGYKIKTFSYGKRIIIMAIFGWLIAFLIFYAVWSITDQFFSNTQNNFWFGIIILTIPTILYSFSFATYLTVLYDSRLADIAKVLTTYEHVRRRFIKLHNDEFEKSEKPYQYSIFKALKNILLNFNDKNMQETRKNAPAGSILPEGYYFNLKKAYNIQASILTELIQKIAIKMDGATMAGYLFPIILLQFIVALSFVIPSVEFAHLGTIGRNIFDTNCKGIDQAIICGYLNFWAITWGVIGAFVYSFISLMERIPRKDVTPRYFLNIALRYIFAVALSEVFFLVAHTIVTQGGIISPSTQNTIASISFIAAASFFIGMFPNRYFRVIGSMVDNKILKNFTRDIPLESFTGIHPNEATRLWEESVDNVDQLADTSVQELYRRTKFDPNRLKGLVGRALLWKYVFGIENMLLIIDPKKLKDCREDVKNRINEIQAFHFSDIQSLCAYIFSKPIDEIDTTEHLCKAKVTELVREKFKDIPPNNYISQQHLEEIAFMTSYFKDQLSFTKTEKEIIDLINEEFSTKKRDIDVLS